MNESTKENANKADKSDKADKASEGGGLDYLQEQMFKKAVGFSYEEVVEEFVVKDGAEVLTKRKVTTKQTPPDVSAAKIVIETGGGDDIDNLSEAELVALRERVLQEIKKSVKCKM
ncbi:MAG: hypothetical protein FWB72_02520 [Firmicutes bacterium]|nr:hypothetical protein [Bacillota bacterium]